MEELHFKRFLHEVSIELAKQTEFSSRGGGEASISQNGNFSNFSKFFSKTLQFLVMDAISD